MIRKPKSCPKPNLASHEWVRAGSTLVAMRARTAAKYRAFTLGENNRPQAATLMTPRHMATYAHGEHAAWEEGHEKEVGGCDGESARLQSIAVTHCGQVGWNSGRGC